MCLNISGNIFFNSVLNVTKLQSNYKFSDWFQNNTVWCCTYIFVATQIILMTEFIVKIPALNIILNK